MECKLRCGRALALTFPSSSCLPAFVLPQPSTLSLNQSGEIHGLSMPGSLITTLLSDICLHFLSATRISMQMPLFHLFPLSLLWLESSLPLNQRFTSCKQIRHAC